MGCKCAEKRNSYQVVTAGGDVAFTSTNRTAADGVAKRYPGSTVQPAAAGGGKPATPRGGQPAAGTKAG